MSLIILTLMAVVGTTIWETIVKNHEIEHEEAEAEKEDEKEEETDYTLVDSGVRISVRFLSDEKQRKARRQIINDEDGSTDTSGRCEQALPPGLNSHVGTEGQCLWCRVS